MLTNKGLAFSPKRIYHSIPISGKMNRIFGLVYPALCLLTSTVYGVSVGNFQSDGSYDANSYMRHLGGYMEEEANGNLPNFTLCFRMTLDYMRSYYSYFISFANSENDNALTANIFYPNDFPLQIQVCKYRYINGRCETKDLINFNFNEWNHYCFVETAVPENEGDYMVSNKLYMNGMLASSTKMTKAKSEFKPLKLGGAFILGQDQDDVGSRFDETQSFSGQLTQVEIWSTELSPDVIADMASCKVMTVDQNRIVGWDDAEWQASRVTITDVSLNELCGSNVLSSHMVIPEKISYMELKTLCDKMGGQLPVILDNINSNNSVIKLQNRIKDVFKMLFDNDINTNSTQNQCVLGGDQVMFWLGQNKINSPEWIDPYNNEKLINFTSGNPSLESDCALVFSDHVEVYSCKQRFACGVCKLPPSTFYKMKGLCKDIIDEDGEQFYDLDYRVYGTVNGKVHFKGLRNSHLYYDSKKSVWKLQSLTNPKMFLETSVLRGNELPIGTREWIPGSEGSFCDKTPKDKVPITLSNCFPGMYTCNSGSCVHLSKKCDTEIDCEDKSDEYYCDYLRFSTSYAKELIPRDESGSPVIVYMNVSVLAFPFIETVNLKFTADFFLNLRWYDLRIDFRDLNNVSSLNSLSEADQNNIWVPKLAFTNALGPYQTEVDTLTNGILIKEDAAPLPEDITLATEAMLFSGKSNSILLTREYYQEYACDFNLLYYPFDTQVCQMVFEMKANTENYVMLAKDGGGVEFMGGRTLVEYEIQKEELQIRSHKNMSQGIVKVVFRRRMEFHVANTFLQTFILIGVGYLSFFFAVDNFTDRVMVSLTTMLVIATVMSSIQAGLPKTSYYKFIDYWLIFSLNMLVYSMAFHTYLASVVAKEKDQPVTLISGITSSESVVNNKFWKQFHGSPDYAVHPIKVDPYTNSTLSKFQDRSGPSYKPPSSREELRNAKRINRIGKIMYALIVVMFNIIFWSLAITEYMKSADTYLADKQ